jgi:hypothetical protein
MTAVLNNGEISPDEKIKLYQNTLQKYLRMNNKAVVVTPNNVQEHGVSNAKDMGDRIISSFPKSLRNRARALMAHMENSPDISWNERGEFVYQNQTLHGSHVHDLIHDIIRNSEKSNPTGWEAFSNALKESNIPRSIVGNERRLQWMQRGEGINIKARKPLNWLSFKHGN